jgi:DNA-binding NarL/FixJ family response regulator
MNCAPGPLDHYKGRPNEAVRLPSWQLTPSEGSSQPAPIRILLVDAQVLVRAGVRLLIENRPGFCVVGEAGDREEALVLAAREQPDVILLDLLDGYEGLDLLPQLPAVARGARMLMLTGVHRTDLHQQAIRLGARGLVLKEDTPYMLLQALAKVHAGDVWLDPALLTALLDELAPHTQKKLRTPEEAYIATLSAREHEVIALVGAGLRNKQIAQRLYISETTVRHHLTSIFAKLRLSDRVELVIYAYRYGLVTLPS